jgi:hypothetical protein
VSATSRRICFAGGSATGVAWAPLQRELGLKVRTRTHRPPSSRSPVAARSSCRALCRTRIPYGRTFTSSAEPERMFESEHLYAIGGFDYEILL